MEVVQDLTCPICLEFYTYPIILPCSHVLCRRPCAENIFEVNFIRCPVCRDNCYINGGITSLPRVIPLESIIEKVRAERKKRAGLKKSTTSTSRADVSQDSAPTSCSDTPRDTVSSVSSSSALSSARDPLHSFSPSSARTLTNACGVSQSTTRPPDELFDDYDRIMRSLSNPPNISGLLRRLNERCSNPYSSRAWSSSHQNPHSTSEFTTSSNHRPESAFSATPTNDVTTDSTVDREIEDILNPPVLGTSNSISSQPVPNARNQTRIDGGTNNVITSHQELTVPLQHGNTEEIMVANVHDVRGNSMVPPDLNVSVGSGEDRMSAEAVVLKHEIQEQLARLSDLQCRLLLYLTSYRDNAQRVQGSLLRDRAHVTFELDSLMAEIEAQRSTLVEGVDGAERQVKVEVNDVTSATEKLLASTQRLVNFADEALSAPAEVLAQTGPAVLDKLSTSVKTCELCLETSEPSLSAILAKGGYKVDFRHERGLLKRLGFLNVPRPPVIDLQKCSRSHDTVTLVLDIPPADDVVDSYQICYCSEEQKYLGIEETVTFNLPLFDRDEANSIESVEMSARHQPLTFLLEHLCSTTRYYFRVCAVNRAGCSTSSDLVQCVTLAKEECVVPVPSIVENLSHTTSPSSAMIVCHGPATVSPHQGVTHFLLFRPGGGAYSWQREELLQGREEHHITRLRPGEEFQFLVLAYNFKGEGQVSEKLSLKMMGDGLTSES